MKAKIWVGLALILGLQTWAGQAMRVEEPDGSTAPPVNPENESAQWKAHSATVPALTSKELAAMRERRKQVEEMAEVIRQKREAVEQADEINRPLKARELEKSILEETEKDDAGKNLEKAEQDQLRRQQIEEKKQQNVMEQEKKAQKENGKPADNGGDNPGKGNKNKTK